MHFRYFLFLPALMFALLVFGAMASSRVEFPATAPGTITFIGDAGSANVFTVEKWKFDRLERLDNPLEIGVTATLDMASITCGWKGLEESLHKKKDYFHSRKFATASITIEGATPGELPGTYRANARVKMKGVTREIPIDFTLSGSGPYRLHATTTIDRRQFRFTGDGPKDEVPVTVDAVVE